MFDLVDVNGKTELDFSDLRRIADQLRFNLSDEDIREVITNVAGYGDINKVITWDKFNKYIQKKIDKRQTILGWFIQSILLEIFLSNNKEIISYSRRLACDKEREKESFV